jgi:hypothetical protein
MAEIRHKNTSFRCRKGVARVSQGCRTLVIKGGYLVFGVFFDTFRCRCDTFPTPKVSNFFYYSHNTSKGYLDHFLSLRHFFFKLAQFVIYIFLYLIGVEESNKAKL